VEIPDSEEERSEVEVWQVVSGRENLSELSIGSKWGKRVKYPTDADQVIGRR
jgi:hypothetical protein